MGGTFAALSALLAGISWIPGASILLTIGVSLLQMVSPLVNGLFTLLIWLWTNILFPGIVNILKSWPTICTVLIMGGALWVGLASRYEIQHIKDRSVIAKCATKDVDNTDTELDLPWPFKWK